MLRVVNFMEISRFFSMKVKGILLTHIHEMFYIFTASYGRMKVIT